MLLFAAGDDRIVSPRAIEEFGVGLKVGTQMLLPGSRHEILQEADGIRRASGPRSTPISVCASRWRKRRSRIAYRTHVHRQRRLSWTPRLTG